MSNLPCLAARCCVASAVIIPGTCWQPGHVVLFFEIEALSAGQVHGILMVSAFGVIIPIGIFTSRYGKFWGGWFNTHRAVQVPMGSASRCHYPDLYRQYHDVPCQYSTVHTA